MVSDIPRESRCAARVVDKVGLELQLDTDTRLTDDTVVIVRLTAADGQHTVDAEPDYEVVREYRWNDYEPTAIAVSSADLEDGACPASWPDEFAVVGADPPADAATHTTAGTLPDWYGQDGSEDAPDDAHRWVTLGDAVEKMKNERVDFQGYCERYPMDNGRCYVHPPGPGAPDPAANAIEHGLYAQRTNFYRSLDDADKQFIEALVDSWLEQSPYDRENVAVLNELYRCGIDQLRAWAGLEEFVDDDTDAPSGLLTEVPMTDDEGNTVTDEDGNEVTVDTEHAANLPYSRLDRDIQSKLKQLDVYNSPESKQADATESLAQKLSGLNEN